MLALAPKMNLSVSYPPDTPEGAAICEQCHQVVGQNLHQELTKNLTADEVATLELLLKKVLP